MASLVWTKLFTDRFVSVVRRDSPAARRGLDLDAFCRASHVVVVPEARARNPLDRKLSERKRSRHVALRVPSFLAALAVVASSELVLTTPERLIDRYGETLSVRTFAPPLPLGTLTMSMCWHERQRRDPGHTWLRNLVAAVGAASAG